MAMSGGKDDGTPMMEINTTPLIDVMLVLLIMFIITIPVATHSVDIDLPVPDQNPPPKDKVDPVKNKVGLTRQAEILWNGEVVTDGQLLALLKQSLTLPVEPELQFEPEPDAPYDL
ncbi:MAG: biopolymer transporter ExbD, partial [Novosphingobium sp.]|nr:biopolymer transporter ExbD [Novosphingobium sp.]